MLLVFITPVVFLLPSISNQSTFHVVDVDFAPATMVTNEAAKNALLHASKGNNW